MKLLVLWLGAVVMGALVVSQPDPTGPPKEHYKISDLEYLDNKGGKKKTEDEERKESDRQRATRKEKSSPVLGMDIGDKLKKNKQYHLYLIPLLITLFVWIFCLCTECCCFKDSEYTLLESAVIAAVQRQILMSDRDEVAEEAARQERLEAKKRRRERDGGLAFPRRRRRSSKRRHRGSSSTRHRSTPPGSKGASPHRNSPHRSSPLRNSPGRGSKGGSGSRASNPVLLPVNPK